MPDEPEAAGLLALMLLHDSRRDARTGLGGELVLLEEQDRSLWDREEIAEGLALAARPPTGPYALQAAIVAEHARAPDPEATDWHRIADLYEVLALVSPSPVVRLNQAVAIALAEGEEHGLKLMEDLDGELGGYHLLHAARADLLRRLGRTTEAVTAYSRAQELAGQPAERAFLTRRLAELHAGAPPSPRADSPPG